MLLKDKVTIVTGTSSGIGIEIADVFSEEGAKVVCAARREKLGQAVVDAICEKGGDAIFVQCDISQPDQVDVMVKAALDKYGRIDALVNNAGVNIVKPFEEITPEDWDRVIGVDLRGTFLCTRACINQFLKQKSGNVLNIGTVHSSACLPGASPYDTAKWGMVGLTKSLAVEFAARNIRFNCLSPGLIDTQIWDDIQDVAEDLDACHKHWWANIPMGRVGTSREMADIAVFLVSDKASYITGTNIFADGGMTSLLISKESYKSRAIE